MSIVLPKISISNEITLANLSDHPIIGIMGKRGSGKTTLVKELLLKLHLDRIYVFTPIIFQTYQEDPPYIENELRSTDNFQAYFEKIKEFSQYSSNGQKCCIVLDDVISYRNKYRIYKLIDKCISGHICLIITLNDASGMFGQSHNFDCLFSFTQDFYACTDIIKKIFFPNYTLSETYTMLFYLSPYKVIFTIYKKDEKYDKNGKKLNCQRSAIPVIYTRERYISMDPITLKQTNNKCKEEKIIVLLEHFPRVLANMICEYLLDFLPTFI